MPISRVIDFDLFKSVYLCFSFTRLDQMSKKTQEELHKNGFNLKLASEASITGLGSASSSSEFGVTKADTDKYRESIETTKIVTIGTKLPEDGKIALLQDGTFKRWHCFNALSTYSITQSTVPDD